MTKTATKSTTSLASFDIKGKGKAARLSAFLRLSTDALAMSKGKRELVADCRLFLGEDLISKLADSDNKTVKDHPMVVAARKELTVGIVADNLPAGEYPKGTDIADDAARMDWARLLLDKYVVQSKAANPRKLPDDKLGYWSEVQARIIGNAREQASKVLAQIGLAGKTASEASATVNRGARGQNASPTPAQQAVEATGEKLETPKVTTPAPSVTSDDYVAFMSAQLAMLVDYDNKHARKRPTTHGAFAEQLRALKQECNKAANLYGERKAKADALRAEKEK